MRRALLLACSDYADESFSNLLYPQKDMDDLAALLRNKDFGAFDEVSILANPTKTEAHIAVEELCEDCSHDDFMLLYFSGHGRLARDGSLALVLSDTKDRLVRATSLLDDDIRALFNASRAPHKAIILDCCHAGAAGEEGFKRAADSAVESLAHQASGTFVIAASTKFQPAFENHDLGGSALTATIIEGITGGGAAPAGTQMVTLSQLAEYVRKKVPSRSNQQPKFWDFGGIGGVVFSHTPKIYGQPWRDLALRTVHHLFADEQLDEDTFEEICSTIRNYQNENKIRLDIIDKLTSNILKPAPFLKRWQVAQDEGHPTPPDTYSQQDPLDAPISLNQDSTPDVEETDHPPIDDDMSIEEDGDECVNTYIYERQEYQSPGLLQSIASKELVILIGIVAIFMFLLIVSSRGGQAYSSYEDSPQAAVDTMDASMSATEAAVAASEAAAAAADAMTPPEVDTAAEAAAAASEAAAAK